MVDGDKAVVWAATATGGILAATAIYWVLQKALDAYVPYQVSLTGCRVHAADSPIAASLRGLLTCTVRLCTTTSCPWSTQQGSHLVGASACLQYHYRPGTFTGWLAHVLDDYSQRRKSEQQHLQPQQQ